MKYWTLGLKAIFHEHIALYEFSFKLFIVITFFKLQVAKLEAQNAYLPRYNQKSLTDGLS